MNYAGVYINLDGKTERRALMEAEFARYNLAYARFRGIEGNVLGWANPHGLKEGVLGCFASHYLALKENAGAGRHLHVVEDDILFAACTGETLRWAVEAGKLDECDILYADISVPLRSDNYKLYRTMYEKVVARNAEGGIESVSFATFDVKDIVYASAASYIVNRASIAKICALYEEEIARGLRMPVDLFLRHACNEGRIKGRCLFPFVTSINIDHALQSSIDEPGIRPTGLARLVGRYSFFVGCDLKKCEDYIDRFLVLPDAGDRHARILGRLLAFSLTDVYRLF